MTSEPDSKTQFVILEGIEYKNRWFTSYAPGDRNPATGLNGDTVCLILGYAETVDEAQIFLYGRAFPPGSSGVPQLIRMNKNK